MDGFAPDERYLRERRRRLAAERTLERTRTELSRAYRALVANADRLSLRYLSEREANLRLTDRQHAILAQRKEAAEKADRARRRLWHALEAMRDGFALFDAEGRLVAANSVYLGLFDAESEIGPGASAEELFRVAAEEGAFVFDEEPDDWVALQLERWRAEEIGTQVLQTFDGRTIRFQDRRAPDGDVVCLAVDLSDERAREESLAAARDAAEETARAKQAFLARMSHEMRTPMNGVLGLAEMLAERDIDPESRRFARTIRDSAEALLTIVGDTLDVSRLEAGRVELREAPFDLEALLMDCVRLAQAGGDGRVPIVLDYPLDAPLRFVGDAGRVRQVAINLIGNAAKFTEAGHVLVRAALSPGGPGAALTLDVRDTGPGIPEDRREAIFDAFAQIEDGRPHREGTGLGLTISRGLAERMGGSLAVVDAGGAGACFRLTLPLELDGAWPDPAPPPAATVPEGTGIQGDVLAARLAAAGGAVSRTERDGVTLLAVGEGPPPASPEGGRLVLLGPAGRIPDALRGRAAAVLDLPVAGADLLAALHGADAAALAAPPAPAAAAPRVLIADDNATNRFLLERLLAGEGFVLDCVEDGARAVAAYRAARPDIVLMDISMPEMDGFEALAAIRAFEEERGGTAAPAIALTAHAGPEIEARLAEAGFADRHAKPVRKPALLKLMAAALAGG